MDSIKCIIVDDEVAARSLLSKIISEHCPGIIVVDECEDVKSAVKSIHQHQPQLVFLDIEMPNHNGFALFDYFETPAFETIFCTAYSEFALQAFEVSAIDYILKPISIQKLQLAIEKAIKYIGNSQKNQRVSVLKENFQSSQLQRIALPNADGLIFVKLDDILYFEADGSYTTVFFKSSKTLITKKLKDFDELLATDSRFFRTHRSYLVNVTHIQKYSKKDGATLEFENGGLVSVSKEKMKDFDQFIEKIKV